MFIHTATDPADLHNLPCSLARIGLDGHIADCNEMFGQILGYQPEELLGKHLDILIQPENREEHAGMMKTLGEASRRIRMAGDRILNCVSKAGHTCPVQLGASPLFQNDSAGQQQLLGWYVSAADATRESALERSNRTLIEEAADNNRRILELYKQREGFLQALCHEIKGSLSDSTDLHRLLRDINGKGDHPKLLAKLASMNANLTASLRKLIDFSELQTGESSLKLQPKNVSSVIGLEALELRREFQLTVSQLTLQFNLPKKLVASTDWKLVRSVIHELVAEAVNYRSADQIRIIVDLELRKENQFMPYKRVGIFALTAGGNQRARDQARQVGIDNFLLKPLSLENLGACMLSLHRA